MVGPVRQFRDVRLPVTLSAAALTIVLVGLPEQVHAACGDCTQTTIQVLKSAEVTQALVKSTAIATNAHITAEIAAQTVAIITGLQMTAGQISGNIRGSVAAQGQLIEALSSHDTKRLVQSDRVSAMHRQQFSTPLCQTSTGAAQTVAMEAVTIPDAVKRAKANATRSAGMGDARALNAVSATFNERRPLFCKADDPACQGQSGSRENGDKMPGAILAIPRLQDDNDRKQAVWVTQNLTQPAPYPALTAAQVARENGQQDYLRRTSAEAMLNLAKDVVTEIMVTRREPTGNATFYNQLAAEAGLPQAPGDVSLEDMERMRFRDRFTAHYTKRLATLTSSEPLLREQIALSADALQAQRRIHEQNDRTNLLLASLVSILLENKFTGLTGKLN